MSIAQTLYNFTARRPCRIINRANDARYLERYWLGRLFGITAYLHRFVSEDADEWVHDHPWGWSIAIVLTGGYREERLKHFAPSFGWSSKYRWLKPGYINIIRAKDFHRIRQCTPETWTLFIHGPRIKQWGFLEFDTSTQRTTYHQPLALPEHDWHKTAPSGGLCHRAFFKPTEI